MHFMLRQPRVIGHLWSDLNVCRVHRKSQNNPLDACRLDQCLSFPGRTFLYLSGKRQLCVHGMISVFIRTV